MMPTLIQLPKIHDNDRGNLTVIESGKLIPFDIKRVYYLYDIPGGGERAGHAHKKLEQLLIAVSGSFKVVLNDGKGCIDTYWLDRAFYGLYIPPMHWRTIENFSSGAVCLVLASAYYDESDYYRDFRDFVGEQGGEKTS
jgi:glyoxylate utilization-related uncharacterized protein